MSMGRFDESRYKREIEKILTNKMGTEIFDEAKYEQLRSENQQDSDEPYYRHMPYHVPKDCRLYITFIYHKFNEALPYTRFIAVPISDKLKLEDAVENPDLEKLSSENFGRKIILEESDELFCAFEATTAYFYDILDKSWQLVTVRYLPKLVHDVWYIVKEESLQKIS